MRGVPADWVGRVVGGAVVLRLVGSDVAYHRVWEVLCSCGGGRTCFRTSGQLQQSLRLGRCVRCDACVAVSRSRLMRGRKLPGRPRKAA